MVLETKEKIVCHIFPDCQLRDLNPGLSTARQILTFRQRNGGDMAIYWEFTGFQGSMKWSTVSC